MKNSFRYVLFQNVIENDILFVRKSNKIVIDGFSTTPDASVVAAIALASPTLSPDDDFSCNCCKLYEVMTTIGIVHCEHKRLIQVV